MEEIELVNCKDIILNPNLVVEAYYDIKATVLPRRSMIISRYIDLAYSNFLEISGEVKWLSDENTWGSPIDYFVSIANKYLDCTIIDFIENILDNLELEYINDNENIRYCYGLEHDCKEEVILIRNPEYPPLFKSKPKYKYSSTGKLTEELYKVYKSSYCNTRREIQNNTCNLV